MKLYVLLALLSLTAVAVFGVTTRSPNDRSFAGDPSKVVIDKRNKKVDVAYSGFKYGARKTPVSLTAENREFVKGLAANRHKFIAGGRNGAGTANIGQHRANVVAFDNGADPKKFEDLQGGAVSSGNHRGNLRFINESTVNMEGNGRAKMVAGMTDFDKRRRFFEDAYATNERIDARMDPSTLDKDGSKGVLRVQDKRKLSDDFYLYKVEKNQRSKMTDAFLTSSQGSRPRHLDERGFDSLYDRAEKWHCTASVDREGESICKDKRGRVVGRVLTTKDEVKVFDKNGVVVGEGKVVASKTRNRYEAILSKGLFTAKVQNLKHDDCTRELGGQAGKLKIKKPLHFDYPRSNSGNEFSVAWPSCFTIGADFEVAAGVDLSGIALEFDAHVRPIGRLRCQDQATCGKECFYCDVCGNSHKMDIARTSSMNLCNVTGVRTFTAKFKVCPPPEEFEKALCSAFTKDLDYINNKGDGVFQVVAWQMPPNREKLRKEFLDKISDPLAGTIHRTTLLLQYKSESGLGAWLEGSNWASGSSWQSSPVTQEMMEWYIGKRKANRMKPLACYRETLDYTYGGSKANLNVFVDVATTNSDSFFRKRCPKKVEVDAEQFAIHQEEHKEACKNGQRRGGLGGVLGGIFGGNDC